jgi:hypothetical protein
VVAIVILKIPPVHAFPRPCVPRKEALTHCGPIISKESRCGAGNASV